MKKDAKAELAQSLQQALELLQAHPSQPTAVPTGEPLHSLLAQCQAVVAACADPVPVRCLHHFACTGGTLISKCLALMPNVTLLSEIDPLSQIISAKGPQFWPSDILFAGRVALRPISDEMTIRSFNAGLAALHKALLEEGRSLVLRDHAHSHFCTAVDPASRPNVREIVQRVLPVLSAITVRHPLDSFLSLGRNRWGHFSPFTLETYAERYELFLAQYADLPLFRYEDFVTDPDQVLERICDALDLSFQPGALVLLKGVKMSGDSGRSSPRIAPRPRRAVPEDVAAAAESSAAYRHLCERLGYPANPG